jgi:hypothetical protein
MLCTSIDGLVTRDGVCVVRVERDLHDVRMVDIEFGIESGLEVVGREGVDHPARRSVAIVGYLAIAVVRIVPFGLRKQRAAVR